MTDNSAIVDDILLTDNTDFGEKAALIIWEYKMKLEQVEKIQQFKAVVNMQNIGLKQMWGFFLIINKLVKERSRILIHLIFCVQIVKHCKYSCCPSIVLTIAGPWICVLGAIYLEKPVIKSLIDFILMINQPEDDGIRVKQLVTLFEALRLTYQTLDNFYIHKLGKI